MQAPSFRPEYLAFLLPIIIAIMLEKGPPFIRTWWKNIVDKEWKPTVLLLISIAVVLLIRGFACLHVDVGLGATCDNPSDPQLWVNTIGIGIAVWISMEITYQITTAASNLKQNDPGLNVEKMTGPTYITTNNATTPPVSPPAGSVKGIDLSQYSGEELRELMNRIVEQITKLEAPPVYSGPTIPELKGPPTDESGNILESDQLG